MAPPVLKSLLRLVLLGAFAFQNAWVLNTHAQESDFLTRTYLGIAGPGTGADLVGHAFLVFTPEKHTSPASTSPSLENGTAYQYAIQLPAGTKGKFLGLAEMYERLMNDELPLIIERENAAQLTQRYAIENQVVQLFELSLSGSERGLLLEKLEKERQARNAKPHHDFNSFGKNTTAKLVDLLNSVVTKERQLKSIWTKNDHTTVSRILTTRGWLANIPAALAVDWRDHPLFKSRRVIAVETLAMTRARISLQLHHSLSSMARECGWSEREKTTYQRLSSNYRTLMTEAFLKTIHQRTEQCQQEAMKARFEFASFALYSYLYLSEEKARTDPLDWKPSIREAIETL